jgi:hypothetical protein
MLSNSKSDIMFLKKKKRYLMPEYQNLEKKPIFNQHGSRFNEKIDKKSDE